MAGRGEGCDHPRSDRDDSEGYLVRVVRDRRGNHFWASREMRPMAREESEGFVTYSAGSYGEGVRT